MAPASTIPNLAASAPFTVGVPRRTSVGGPDVSRDSPVTFDDEWTLVLPMGQRPGTSVPGMPKIGDELTETIDGESIGKGFVVTRISWKQNSSTSNVWVATLTYAPGKSKVDDEDGPIGSDFDFQWGCRSVQADLMNDAVTGAAVMNSAKEPFDSVPQREMLLPCVSFRRISAKHPSFYAPYNGTVNNVSVTVMGITFAKHCARILIEAKRIEEGEDEQDAGKYEYSFRIEGASNMYAPNSSTSPVDIGWDVSMLDCGYSYLDEANRAHPIMIEGADGSFVRPTSPQLLCNGSFDPVRGVAYFLKFSPYPESSWASLHLPA